MPPPASTWGRLSGGPPGCQAADAGVPGNSPGLSWLPQFVAVGSVNDFRVANFQWITTCADEPTKTWLLGTDIAMTARRELSRPGRTGHGRGGTGGSVR